MSHRTPSIDEVRADFDRIARAVRSETTAGALSRGERALLSLVPRDCELAIDLGCGYGRLVPALAKRASRVIAIDASSEMIALARERCALSNVTFVEGEFLAIPLPNADCIVSIDTLHHLSLARAFERIATLLTPGGRLLAVDLFAVRTPLELALGAYTCCARLLSPGAPGSPALHAAYEAHGRHESYPTLREVRAAARVHLRGASVRARVGHRYRLRWDAQRRG